MDRFNYCLRSGLNGDGISVGICAFKLELNFFMWVMINGQEHRSFTLSDKPRRSQQMALDDTNLNDLLRITGT